MTRGLEYRGWIACSSFFSARRALAGGSRARVDLLEVGPSPGPLRSAARVDSERFGTTQAMPTSAASKRLIGDRYDADR
ncbi:MAG: hypothetical protein MI919_38915, partial [Holophagales bacterium]|nr:hypothetical protein [Holophagales bacterium]